MISMKAAIYAVSDVVSREEPFDPMDMPDFALLLTMAEWHDHKARELARSGADLSPVHRKAARCLRDVYDYMRQLRTILTDDDEFLTAHVSANRRTGRHGHRV
jgi:hypothetical protein